jgi:tRNA-Thr(GGU) m(6)t(6)A37 methyltransferase TsaA
VSTGPFDLRPIGRVSSALIDPVAAPKQASEGAPEAWLLFDESVAGGIVDLRAGDRVVVLTWLHRARRDVLAVHPRDDLTVPQKGVFSTRSADRPNPLGIHRTEIVAVDGLRILVRELEAVDGTPIVDIKPALD